MFFSTKKMRDHFSPLSVLRIFPPTSSICGTLMILILFDNAFEEHPEWSDTISFILLFVGRIAICNYGKRSSQAHNIIDAGAVSAVGTLACLFEPTFDAVLVEMVKAGQHSIATTIQANCANFAVIFLLLFFILPKKSLIIFAIGSLIRILFSVFWTRTL